MKRGTLSSLIVSDTTSHTKNKFQRSRRQVTSTGWRSTGHNKHINTTEPITCFIVGRRHPSYHQR
eukprot:scaffold5701_cov155-Skeletonema_dohrnii-CCMP3373.AAC.6